ncbi:MAG TPA: ubiquinone/menaquinone biosynthesis methyltransferase [Nitriliruptorales bacterium]
MSAVASLPDPGRRAKDLLLVQAMFDRVAPRYDLLNSVLSLGQDAHWRRVAAAAATPAGRTVLDVAAGTGALSHELIARGAREVVALDLSWAMLTEGARRLRGRNVPDVRWLNADAQRLPLPTASVDAVTIAFGLRNVPDPEIALSEFARVTRPGGQVVVLEFARPTWEPFRRVYDRYLTRGLPRVAQALSPSPEAYGYLAQSILAWPDRRCLADWMEATGWCGVEVKDLSGGIVAIHRATRTT